MVVDRTAPTPLEACADEADCGLELATGRCRAVAPADRDALRRGSVELGEAYCECAPAGCTLRRAEPLACKTDAECWYERKGGRLVPTRPKTPRKLPFKPCSDGEIDARCTDSVCKIVAFKC